MDATDDLDDSAAVIQQEAQGNGFEAIGDVAERLSSTLATPGLGRVSARDIAAWSGVPAKKA